MNRHLKKIIISLLCIPVLVALFAVYSVIKHKQYNFTITDIGIIRYASNVEASIETGGNKYNLNEDQFYEVKALIDDLSIEPPFGWRDQNIVNCALNLKINGYPNIYRIDIESAGDIFMARLQSKSGVGLYYYEAFDAKNLVKKLDEFSNDNCTKAF
jgi:hypothetical protein